MASSETDIDNLSVEQQSALQQYTSVTGQDLTEAIPLLRRSQWNTQIAVTKFFDGEQPDPIAEARANQNVAPRQPVRQENLQDSLLRESYTSQRTARAADALDVAPRIVPQPTDQLPTQIPFLLRLIFSPFTMAYRVFASVFSTFGNLIPYFRRNFTASHVAGIHRQRDTSGRRTLNPRDTMARFRREFEEEYGPHSLPFVDNGYAQALDLAKKELKFLLVVLTSPEHDDTETFMRDTLLAPEVATFLNQPDHEIVLWAGNVLDSEAYQVSTGLKCTKFPASVLIAHTPERGATTMSVVARVAGHTSPDHYVTQLRLAINKHKAPLAAERAARQAQQFDRSIRQEQDSAYMRSLAQDRERTRQRKEAQTAMVNAEKEAAQMAIAAEIYEKNLQDWRRWRAGMLEAEPKQDEPGVVRIGLKLPDTAERITRRFRGGADIEELYAFVECHGLTEGSADDASSSTPPKDFKHEYKFNIVSPLPRQVYSVDAGGSIVERIGKSGNLIVERMVDDEDS